MTSTAAQVVAGLHVRFATVTALKTLLVGEPESLVGDLPALYTRLVSRTETMHAQLSAVRYRCLHRVCVLWQDNAAAEAEILALADSVPAAVWADAHLGLTDALVQSFDGECGFVEELGVRCIDFYSETLVKG